MIFENLEQNFIDTSIIPEGNRAMFLAAFRKGMCGMVDAILLEADTPAKFHRFLGKIETELELYKKSEFADTFIPYKEPSPKAVFADDPMWLDPHNGEVGGQYAGLTDYNSTVHGTLRIRYGGVGDGDYYFIIDGDGREWGVTKIATVEGFNKASNANDLWFLPSFAYVGQEVVGLTPSGQNVFGAKLFQSDGIWYVKGENERVGLEVIRIAIPEVYKKMQEIKDAKDLRDEK